jgi:hypothetical protein
MMERREKKISHTFIASFVNGIRLVRRKPLRQRQRQRACNGQRMYCVSLRVIDGRHLNTQEQNSHLLPGGPLPSQ